MKKMFISLLLLFSMVLAGCAPKSLILSWADFVAELHVYQEKMGGIVRQYNPVYVSKSNNDFYTRDSLIALQEELTVDDAMYWPEEQNIVPFQNIINRFVGYVEDEKVAGFGEVFEVNPSDFGATAAILIYVSTGDIYAHLVKPAFSLSGEAASYESYHIGRQDGQMKLESITSYVSQNAAPNFNYFRYIENDYFLYYREQSSGTYYDSYSVTSPAKFRTALRTDRSIDFVQWYDEEERMTYYANFDQSIGTYYGIDIVDDYGRVIFDYAEYDGGTLSMTWELLEMTGWTNIYDPSFNTSNSSQNTTVYQGTTILFSDLTQRSIRTTASNLYVALSLRADFSQFSELTDELVTLSKYGLTFSDERLSLSFLTTKLAEISALAPTLTSHLEFDFEDEDLATNFLDSLDEFFVPEELIELFFER